MMNSKRIIHYKGMDIDVFKFFADRINDQRGGIRT